MLKTIRGLNTKEQEGLLAHLAMSLRSPIDSVPAAPFGDERDAFYQNLKDEIAAVLGVDIFDMSPGVQRKVNAFLQRALRDIAFDSKRIKETRNRLGQSGLLPVGLYEVKFGDDFAELCVTMGVKRTEVEQTIFRPRITEHYLPERFGQDNGRAISLFVRDFGGDDPYTIWVDTSREGARLVVHYALRIFHSDIDLSSSAKAIDILSLFIEKYGLDVSFNDGMPRKLFFYVREKYIPAPGRSDQQIFRVTHIAPFGDARCSWILDGGDVLISLGYGIDITKYAEALVKRGLNVTRKYQLASGDNVIQRRIFNNSHP